MHNRVYSCLASAVHLENCRVFRISHWLKCLPWEKSNTLTLSTNLRARMTRGSDCEAFLHAVLFWLKKNYCSVSLSRSVRLFINYAAFVRGLRQGWYFPGFDYHCLYGSTHRIVISTHVAGVFSHSMQEKKKVYSGR
jgi:hypothetical protein